LIKTVGPIEKPLDRILGQILGVGSVELVIIKKGLVLKKPEHVRPPETVAGAVGVFIGVREGVVDPVPGHPVNGASFGGKDSEESQQVLHGLGDPERLMREEPVITEANANPPRQPREESKEEESRPGKGKGSSQSPPMHQRDPKNNPGVVFLQVSLSLLDTERY